MKVVKMNTLQMSKKILNIIDNNADINCHIKENEEVIINYFNHHQQSININITQDNNSKLIFNSMSIVNENIKFDMNVTISGNNNEANINVRAIAQDNYGDFHVNVKANSKTHGNIIVEDLKGILEGGFLNMMPVLEIDTEDVDVSHFATIGGFNQDALFYLNSKGLSNEVAIELLKRNFMYSLFDKEFIELIK